MNNFAKVCQLGKEKVHVAEEIRDYDSDESLLTEGIIAINDREKQLILKITTNN